jgi:hypothetical protein
MQDHEDSPSAGASAQQDDLYAALDQIVEERYVTVSAGDQDLTVTAESIDPDQRLDPQTVIAVLPRIKSLLADFAALRERATEYLWAWGAGEEETDDDKAEFMRNMVPSTLVIASATTIELHYEDISEKYIQDGYWPAVHFDKDMMPTHVSVEA